MATDKTHIILLKIGTNSQDKNALDTLVNTIVTNDPNVQLIIAEIIPKHHYVESIVDYNSYIRETLVPKYQGLGKRVSLVNQYVNFLTDRTDLDSIDSSLFSNDINHPTNHGYDLMAQTWYKGIKSILPLSPASDPSGLIFTTASYGPFIHSTKSDELAFAADVSNSDLLQQSNVTATCTNWVNRNGAHHSGINDGEPGGDYDDIRIPYALYGAAWAGKGGNVSSCIFDLGSGSGFGYDIEEIQSIAAWQGAGFPNQKYLVSVRYLGNTNFSPLGTVDYQPFPHNIKTAGGSTKVNVTAGTGYLATGVDAIKFSILNTISDEAGGPVFREIDVFGTQTTP